MTARRFAQVDVFTDVGLRGNPVAVVLDADGLDTATMQAFTDWTNLSEATFIVPPTSPDADYAVRIFSPGQELPFAGHPTLGTCHAWLAAGGVPRGDVIVQECGVGLVSIRRAGEVLSFAAPERRRTGPLDDIDSLYDALGLSVDDVISHAWCDNGPPWEGLLLRNVATLLALQPNGSALFGRFIGVAAVHSDGELEVRGFFPGAQGTIEDPVTGSLNASLGQWLIGAGLMPESYTARQGTALGRAGRVHVQRIDGQVWVGGTCITVLDGTAHL